MKSSSRLYFIDAVRAFAILMMLQGHFIDTLLDVSFRDPNNMAFSIWQYFRGITAPIFFTISGLIFTYLLLKSQDKGTNKHRLQKGIRRGLMLIAIGYVLRIPILRWLAGSYDSYFLVVDVLQCIGLALILIILCYKMFRQNNSFFSQFLLWIGVVIFLFEPWYRTYDASGIPLVLANYLTKVNGSVFTIFPWFGYMAIGAFIASLFYRYEGRLWFKPITVITFLLSGLILIYYSTSVLKFLGYHSKIQLFIDVSNFNYLFIRLGNVLVIFGLFYAFENLLNQSLFLKIGQKTLSIYVIHFIVLYGSFTGLGLNRIFGKNLNPYEAVIGAIIFLIIISLTAIYRVKANTFIYAKVQIWFTELRNFIVKKGTSKR